MKWNLVGGYVRFLAYTVTWTIDNEADSRGFYDAESKDAFVTQLNALNIPYEVTEHDLPSQDVLGRVTGRKFNTAEEAKAFIEQNDVEVLKSELAETDYKIIKAYEYSLVGLSLPYNIEQLHAERQAIRDKINQLEGD